MFNHSAYEGKALGVADRLGLGSLFAFAFARHVEVSWFTALAG